MPPAPRRIGRFNALGFATLFRRELRRYVRDGWETIAAPAFSTLVYFAVLYLALGPARDLAGGADVLSFAVPGLVMLALLQRAAEATSLWLLFDRMEGVIGDVLAAPLGPLEITLAYALAGMLSGFATGAVTLATLLAVWPVAPAAPWALFAFGLLGALMLSLWGILVGLWSAKWDHWAAAFVFVIVPLCFLSGLFAPVEGWPAPWPAVIRLNPVFHAIDGFRFGLLGIGDQPPLRALVVVAAACLAQGAACLVLIARGWRLRP